MFFFSKSIKEGSEEKQELSARGTGVEGKTQNLDRQTEDSYVGQLRLPRGTKPGL